MLPASFLAQILTQLHEVPLLHVVRSVVNAEGKVESGEDGVEIVSNFHAELPEQCHRVFIGRSSAAWDRTKQGLYPSPVERKTAEAFKLSCNRAELCVIRPRNQNSTLHNISGTVNCDIKKMEQSPAPHQPEDSVWQDW